MEGNKAAPSAPPPWGSCCLPFGKDFLCLGLISGAHPKVFPHFLWISTFLGFPNEHPANGSFLISYACVFSSSSPTRKNAVVTKMLAPEFCAESSNR